MKSRKNVLKKSDIYAILDAQAYRARSTASLINNFTKNKIKIIQIRDKKSAFSKVLKNVLLIKREINGKALIIVNDSSEICLLTDADGVHLGQSDLSVKFAKKILPDKIIGVSCHNIKQAMKAQEEGADYIGFGPIFKTPTKKECKPIGTDKIKLLKKKIRIPFFVIGGINLERLKIIKPLKINRIAVCRALCKTNNLSKRIKQLRSLLN